MRVMVTGGAGYIGSAVTDELLAANHTVVVVDNFSKGHLASIPKGVSVIGADIADRRHIADILRVYRIEAVVHLAAASLVGESIFSPEKYYRTNVIGTLLLLDAMVACQVATFVFSSTAAVYGEPAKQPIEENERTQPTNPYGETKLAVENALPWYEAAHGIHYASLRYFNASGATPRCGESHDPETHLIPLLLQTVDGDRETFALNGDDYPTPDGTCIRDYVHVSDIARAHVQVLGILNSRSAVYNLGTGIGGYSVRQVIDSVERVTGVKVPVQVVQRRPGDPAILIASSDKIRNELQWVPQFQDIDSIVASAWNWKKNNPRGYEIAGA